MIRPAEWEGEVHRLTVTSVTLPEDQFDDGEMEYEISHPPTCGTEIVGGCEHSYVQETCALAWIERDGGLPGTLRYSGTPVTEPGVYQVRAWGREISCGDLGTEYDNGIGVVRWLCMQQPAKTSTARCELPHGHDSPPEDADATALHMATFHVGPTRSGKSYKFWPAQT